LREHHVDAILWKCLKGYIIELARGASNLRYHDMKLSADFIAAKQDWCKQMYHASVAEKVQVAIAEGHVQAVAVQKQRDKAQVSTLWRLSSASTFCTARNRQHVEAGCILQVSLALRKLSRKLEAQKRTEVPSGASCTVCTCTTLNVLCSTSALQHGCAVGMAQAFMIS
jgi:hypothetical protein